MVLVTVSRSIAAPADIVFRSFADVEALPDIHPDVVRVAFDGGTECQVGMTFTETRRMGKREMQTHLEVTELTPGRSARMVADSHGTTWDTTFQVTDEGATVRLDYAMEARAHKLLPKILNPIMKGLFRKGLVTHMDHVQAWCERVAAD